MTLQATHRTSAFDIEVQSINIISSAGNQVNIWPLIEKFRLNETLLLPITYGECWVLDGINLIDKIGMTGFDHIQFAFGNPGQPKLITKSFRIYNVVDRQRVSNGAQTYRLLFCSEELYLASQYSISKSFKGKKISDMVKDIAINTLKIPKDRLAIEETVGNYNMILPYMRPFEAINYISRKALTKSDHPSFVFYETLAEGFKFSSIETLFKNPEVATYQYKQTRLDSLAIDPYGIIQYNIRKNFDTLSDTQSGKYSSNMMTFDLVRQVSDIVKFDLEKFFKSTTHIEPKGSKSKMSPLQNRKGDAPNQAFESHSRFVTTTLNQPNSEYVKSHQPNIKPQQIEKTDLQRNSFLQNFNDHRINITVPGNSTIQSGQVVILNILSPEVQGQTPINEGLSGRYIITTASHAMTESRKYYTELSLVKDDTLSKTQPSDSIGFGDIF